MKAKEGKLKMADVAIQTYPMFFLEPKAKYIATTLY
jgi:hypothetical protein